MVLCYIAIVISFCGTVLKMLFSRFSFWDDGMASYRLAVMDLDDRTNKTVLLCVLHAPHFMC